MFNQFLKFEDAAKESADELTQPRPAGEEKVEDIQIMLKSTTNPVQIRQLKVSVHLNLIVCKIFLFFNTVHVYMYNN